MDLEESLCLEDFAEAQAISTITQADDEREPELQTKLETYISALREAIVTDGGNEHFVDNIIDQILTSATESPSAREFKPMLLGQVEVSMPMTSCRITSSPAFQT